MPTLRGWAVAGTGVALIAAGRILGSQAPEQLGFALVALVVIASGVALLRTYDVTVIRSVTPQRAKAGQPVQVSLRVVNQGRPISSLLLVEDQVPAGLSAPARFAFGEVEGGGDREATYAVRPSRRGRYLVGPTWASFLDPFGVACTRTCIADPSTMLVHPRVEPLSLPRDLGDLRSVATSALSQPAVARGEDFYTLREYVEGDDLRRVHWPSTAKRDRYMIRQEETPWHTRATVILDDRRSSLREPFERAVEAAASLVDLYQRSGYSFRLLCASGRAVGFGRGDHHLTRCLDLLATVEPDGPPESLLTRLAEVAEDTKPQAALALVSPRIGRDEAVSLVAAGRRSRQVSAVSFQGGDEAVEVMRLLKRSGIRAVTVPPEAGFAQVWDRVEATPARGAAWDLKRALA